MNRLLPIYDATIDNNEDGIIVMSLVNSPATEINWMTFSENEEKVMFSVISEEEHILAGVVMEADKPIYRIAPNGEEYYIKFNKDVIKQMSEKMLSDNTFNNIDINHNGKILDKSHVKLVELFIKDESKGISPNYLNVNDGSLLANYKIYDEQLWQMAKNGELNGFSLEGLFTMKKCDNKKHNKMSKIKDLLKQMLTSFSKIETDNATLVYDGEFAVGVEVYDENGEAIADGEYATEDKVIVVKDGVVTEIQEKEDDKKPDEKVVETAEVEKPTEKPTEKPAEKPDEKEELKIKISELEDRISKLEELVQKINEETVAKPIEEQEFSKSFKKTKNRAVEIASYLNK